jgi:transketolase
MLDELEVLGIDLRSVAVQLENEGIQKFIEPYDELLERFEDRRHRLRARAQVKELANVATALRRDVIRMTTVAGSGHPSSCLSCADLVAALFFHQMRWDPKSPKARNVDTFVLSKGHAAPILWAALWEASAVGDDLLTLRRFDSTLEGHPTPRNPWVRVATGSLGQGLSFANGMALANRLDHIDAKIYCLMGDGECSEGSVWEAAQFASLNRLSNVVAIVDVNAFGQSGLAPYRGDTSVLARRFQAFGWKAITLDGHDIGQILDALHDAQKGGPTALIARTVKGKGVSLLEGEPGWHGKALKPDQMRQALDELGDGGSLAAVAPRRAGTFEPTRRGNGSKRITVDYERDASVATRTGFGKALEKLAAHYPDLVVLDGDVKDSTREDGFATHHPDRFVECYIAEQNMAGVALGLSSFGKLPVAATFAAFLTRAHDFVRMAAHSRPEHLVFCGSHAGVSIGQDGPSQMGLEDLAMFRAVLGSTVLYPSDAVSAERLTEEALRCTGIVYLRTTRPETSVLYSNDESFPVGGSKLLRSSEHDQVAIVAAGITVHEALAAFEELGKQGMPTRVIDAYSVKPLDESTIQRAARETRGVVVVEDHAFEGGLGDAVSAAIGDIAPVRRLAVRSEPRSGSMAELLDAHGISRRSIVEVATALVTQRGPDR